MNGMVESFYGKIVLVLIIKTTNIAWGKNEDTGLSVLIKSYNNYGCTVMSIFLF